MSAETGDVQHLREALALAVASARTDGGPFGAVVARGDEVIGRGTNRVVREADPTLHAEVVALREACRALGSHRLDGTTLYTSCEPCPMCFGAAWWARVARIVYAASRFDAARAGFDDADIFTAVAQPPEARPLPTVRALADEGAEPFAAWTANPARVAY